MFCAGADLALIRASVATPQGLERMLATVQAMQRVFARLEQLPCSTLAELGGATLGGGFELALACDWRIAAHEARVFCPEAGLGLLAAGGGTQRLTRLLGPGPARRLILGGETLTGEQSMLQLGLVQWSVPRAALQSAAQALAERVAQVPRYTLAENKRCIGWPRPCRARAALPRSPPRGARIRTRNLLPRHRLPSTETRRPPRSKA